VDCQTQDQEVVMADLIKKEKDLQVARRTWELHSFPSLHDRN
jgi:hypothetical protein